MNFTEWNAWKVQNRYISPHYLSTNCASPVTHAAAFTSFLLTMTVRIECLPILMNTKRICLKCTWSCSLVAKTGV